MSKDYDPEYIVIRKRQPTAKELKSSKVINQAQRSGVSLEQTVKFGAASNKKPQTDLNTARLDRDNENLHHKTVEMSVAKAIQKGRQDKGLTQKDLAAKICEKIHIVTDYEGAKGLPNQQVLAKMERVLGIKLRGKGVGQPLDPKPSKK